MRQMIAILDLASEHILPTGRAVVGAVDARELLALQDKSNAPAPREDPDVGIVPPPHAARYLGRREGLQVPVTGIPIAHLG